MSNVLRNSYANRTELKESLHLTDEQRQAVEAIGSAITEPHQETFAAGHNRQR
ncbi:MAG: hypothetical protein ACLRXQ_05015 [Phascolarctobacterium faecium]